jgi:hypothetical protein
LDDGRSDQERIVGVLQGAMIGAIIVVVLLLHWRLFGGETNVLYSRTPTLDKTHATRPSQQDPAALRRYYESIGEIILSIDGLQPEKGHETLYVLRELTARRVWFAEP